MEESRWKTLKLLWTEKVFDVIAVWIIISGKTDKKIYNFMFLTNWEKLVLYASVEDIRKISQLFKCYTYRIFSFSSSCQRENMTRKTDSSAPKFLGTQKTGRGSIVTIWAKIAKRARRKTEEPREPRKLGKPEEPKTKQEPREPKETGT